MIERLESPSNVVAVRTVGKLTRSDYETVLEPAIVALVEATGELRAVVVVGDAFDGLSLGAAWEDTKVGVTHLSKWKRCAVVTDKDWVRHGVAMFRWMIPGEIKIFPESEVPAAVEWAAA